jgi:gluconolactonase
MLVSTITILLAALGIQAEYVKVSGQFSVLPEPFSRQVSEPYSQTKTELSSFAEVRNAKFLSFDPKFDQMVGNNPKFTVVAEKSIPFAHEAGIFVPETKEIFFTSNRLGDTSTANQSVEIYKMNVDTYQVSKVEANPPIPMANGGTLFNGKIILLSQGLGEVGASIYSMDPKTYKTELILNNYFGLKFNSLNDVVVSRKDGSFWFTDPSYGYEQHFRSQPQLGDFVYRWSPKDGAIKLAADGFVKPNGICFSPDETKAYISDTGYTTGVGETDVKRPHTIYSFDVVYSREGSGDAYLQNRRVFAMADNGIPDGIKVDTNGNLFVGAGDGVQVYSKTGKLLGKILTGGAANLVFAGNKLFVLAETKVYQIQLNTKGVPLF